MINRITDNKFKTSIKIPTQEDQPQAIDVIDNIEDVERRPKF